MSRKAALKEAALKLVDAGQLNREAVKDLVALAKSRVEKLPGVDGAADMYVFADKGGGSHTLETGLTQMIAARDYMRPWQPAGHDKSVKPDKPTTNPFVGLRRPDGTIKPEQMAKVESFIKAAGTKAAAAVAKSAGLRLDGSPIDPKYL